MNRAFNICSTQIKFDNEIKFLIESFNNNGSDNLFYKTMIILR